MRNAGSVDSRFEINARSSVDDKILARAQKGSGSSDAIPRTFLHNISKSATIASRGVWLIETGEKGRITMSMRRVPPSRGDSYTLDRSRRCGFRKHETLVPRVPNPTLNNQ